MDRRHRAAVAQLVEHVIRNDGVGGSSPFSGTTKLNYWIFFQELGGTPEKLIHPSDHPYAQGFSLMGSTPHKA